MTFQIEQLSLQLGKPPRTILKNISLSIAKGESLGIVGESGSGKSTLARVLAGMYSPTGGSVRFDGKNISDCYKDKSFRRKIQMVFQDPHASLNPRLRMRSILAEPAIIHGMKENLAEKIKTITEAVGLSTASLEKFPHEFSGGQKQRICIARALMLDPDVLIADEPVSALDVSIQAQIISILRKLRQERGLTLIFISHDLGVIEQICDRVVVMKDGTLVEELPATNFFSNARRDYTKNLLRAAQEIVDEV